MPGLWAEVQGELNQHSVSNQVLTYLRSFHRSHNFLQETIEAVPIGAAQGQILAILQNHQILPVSAGLQRSNAIHVHQQ